MKPTNISVPIALQKATNKLVNAKDVENGKACNCYCFGCKQDLIAVNQEIKQKAHFRHSPEAKCSFKESFETYIHWLAKEIFKDIKSINLPALLFSDLNLSPTYHKNILNELKLRLNKAGILDEFAHINLSLYNTTIQKPEKLIIDSFDIEKTINTSKGDIRVDIVLTTGGNNLFIEPFFTNEIDNSKLAKIRVLDTSTISINLFNFIRVKSHDFTINELKDFIENNTTSKKWIYIRNSKAEKLINTIFNKSFENKLNYLVKTVNANRTIKKNLEEKMKMRNELQIEINNLSDSLREVDVFDLFKS